MQRGCGWCAGGANASLVGEPIACVAMREDPCDEPRVGDFGDDVQGRTNAAGAWMRRSGDTNGATTAWTVTEVDLEHSAQTLHPAHRCRGFGLAGYVRGTLSVVRREGWRLACDYLVTMLRMRREQSVVTHQVNAGARYQSGDGQAIKSSGSNSTCVVPLENGCFSS